MTDLRESTEGHILGLMLQDLLVHILGLIGLDYNVARPQREYRG